MKAKGFAMAAIFCLAAFHSSITSSDPLVCVLTDGTRMAACPAFLTVTDWGDICTVHHDGTYTRSFGCTEIATDGSLTCLQVGCMIGEQDMGCEGTYFDDRPCEGHQDLVDEFELFDLINQARVAEGVPEVQYHPIASNSVEAYAEFICARGGCDIATENCHRLDGNTGGGRLSDVGIGWSYWCENLAFGTLSPRGAFDLWMDSLYGHRDCILNEDVTQAGVAHVDCAAAPDTWIMIQFVPRSLGGGPLPMRAIRPTWPFPFKLQPLAGEPRWRLPPMESGTTDTSTGLPLPAMESGAKASAPR